MLFELISALSKEEVRHIKLFLNRTNASTDRKDAQLLDLIRNSSNPDDHRFFKKLYPGGEKNAYYRLKNRLAEEIIKALSTLYHNSDASAQAMQVFVVARNFVRKDQAFLALDLMVKAEHFALREQDHGLLELIYSNMLRLVMDHPELNATPQEIITRRMQNHERVLLEQEVDDILGIIFGRMRTVQDEAVKKELLETLREELDNFMFGPRLDTLPVLRLRLFRAYRDTMFIYSGKKSIEKFLRQSYKVMAAQDVFKYTTDNLRIEMLVAIIDLMVKHGKQEKALKYLQDLHSLVFGKGVLDPVDARGTWYMLAYGVYMGLNPAKAAEILQDAAQDVFLKNEVAWNVRFAAPKVFTALQLSGWNAVRDELVGLKSQRRFSTLTDTMKLKVETAELLARWAQSEYDYVRHFINGPLEQVQAYPELEKQRLLLNVLNQLAEGTHSTIPLDTWLKINKVDDFETGNLLDYDRWLLEFRPN
jgi:hypothetical protein